MTTQFLTIGALILFSSMLPGADFAMVTKNTVLHSRRAGLITSLGVGCAILVHITYCALGLAIVISQSLILFSAIKYFGAAYLIYLGVRSFLSTAHFQRDQTQQTVLHRKEMPLGKAFWQGFLCNLLNPKATLFFLALFTVIIVPGTAGMLEVLYAIEMFIIITLWFCGVAWCLSHPIAMFFLEKSGRYISKVLGIFLIAFGTILIFTHWDVQS